MAGCSLPQLTIATESSAKAVDPDDFLDDYRTRKVETSAETHTRSVLALASSSEIRTNIGSITLSGQSIVEY
jgi:hypothetical protein